MNAKCLHCWVRGLWSFLFCAVFGIVAPASVSALCIVGYVNIQLTNGYNFINLQFVPQDDHLVYKISEVFSTNAPDGTKVFLWDVTNQVFTPPSVYSDSAKAWSIDYPLATGPGFVVEGTQSWTLTTVGAVCGGAATNLVAGTNKWSFLGFFVPIAMNLSAASFPILDGANVLLFDRTNQGFSDAFTAFADYGWFDPSGHANAYGPVVSLSQPFFVQNPGPDTEWVLRYQVSFSSALSTSPTTAELQSLGISSNTTTLRIRNDGNVRYNVQFSTDGMVWTSVARNRSGKIWSEKWRGGSKGYYRLTAP